MTRRLLVLVCLLLGQVAVAGAQPQADPPATGGRLRVYLDCFDCFQTYLRDEIEWVDFVRQPQDADVHLLSSSSDTGGGGEELVLRFVGMGRFDGVNHELRVISMVNETENLRRESVYRTVIVGLLDYLAHAGLPVGLEVSVDIPETLGLEATPVDDPWNLWVFGLSVDGSIEAEESAREVQWNGGFSGDRVTDQWKISFGVDVEQQHQTFNLDEEDEEPFEVDRREQSLDWFVAKSLGPHWSIGIDGRVESSTFDNTAFSFSTAPAIEFSVFPYTDYATRQFVLQYEAGIQRVKYREITLFDKFEETLWQHQLSASFDQRQPWGSLSAGLEWSQYLHELGLYRLEVDGELDLRITRGLSLEVEGNASRIRDQISLPRRDATSEEVLLELRELQSGYDVRFSIGISYSFGSLFNNVVNPRFDNGGDDFN